MKKQSQQSCQLPKIRCAFHSNEFLTNFCSCKTCLLPLCPSCINIHINQHISMRTNPQLQNINNILSNLYEELQDYGQKFTVLHKKLVQLQGSLEQYRDKLKNKLFQVKSDLIVELQEHFKKIQYQSLRKINQFAYTKNIVKYKQIAKKSVIALKNSQRNFFSDESKIMRMIIKYEANSLRSKLQKFCYNSDELINMQNKNIFNIEIRQNFGQLAIENLHKLLQIGLNEPGMTQEPEDLTIQIKDLYEKSTQKRQKKKSIYRFLSNKNTPLKGLRNQMQQHSCSNLSVNEHLLADFGQIINSNQNVTLTQQRPSLQRQQDHINNILSQQSFNNANAAAYSSVKQSIVKATKQLNFTLNRNKRIDNEFDGQQQMNRRSMSKGKGIKIVQSSHSKVNRISTVQGKRSGLNQSLISCQMDLDNLNNRTEQIYRRFR